MSSSSSQTVAPVFTAIVIVVLAILEMYVFLSGQAH
jgi:hypothetical protein